MGALNNRLIVVVGANASGKSDIGVRLAERFSSEIISADSRQVYRRLDLGTGKVSAEERRGIPHHMIDVVEPGTVFSVFDYQSAALGAIADIFVRRGQPIIVGGTGLYVDSIVEGYTFVPVVANQALRRELQLLDRKTLVELVRAEQHEALAFLKNADKRRLVRAMEVIRAGLPYAATRCHRRPYERLMIGVRWEREELRARIGRRLVRRLDQGMIEEVEGLRKAGVSDEFLYDLGLEYRFILYYLLGQIKNRDELVGRLGIAIAQFAKRQMTWFRRYTDVRWIDGGDEMAEVAARLVAEYLVRAEPSE